MIGNLLIDDLPELPPLAGGAALHTALAARRCGLEVGVHSVVGEDYPVELLEEEGVHLSLKSLSGPGGRAVMRYGPQGRTLVHQGPGHLEMTPQEPHPFETRFVHLAPMPQEWQLYHLAQAAPSSATLDPYPRMTSTYWEALRPLQDRLRALLLNTEELDLEPASLAIDGTLVIKEGAAGGYTLAPPLRWQAVETKVQDQTGAGDAFAGGFVAGLVQELPLCETLKLAAERAAEAISCIGPYRKAKE